MRYALNIFIHSLWYTLYTSLCEALYKLCVQLCIFLYIMYVYVHVIFRRDPQEKDPLYEILKTKPEVFHTKGPFPVSVPSVHIRGSIKETDINTYSPN